MKKLIEELGRLERNARRKRDRLLEIAGHQTLRRRRLNLAAGVLSLLSAAAVTSLLAAYTPPPLTKVVAVVLSTASGLISLLGNVGFKDSEMQEIYAVAAGYLTLRERAHLGSLNDSLDDEERYHLLEELQKGYSDLDEKFERFFKDGASRLGRELSS